MNVIGTASIPLPKITIVTPSYNQRGSIEETIRSVLVQNYPNLEYIIMDSGSTDGSVEIIQRDADRLAPRARFTVSSQARGCLEN